MFYLITLFIFSIRKIKLILNQHLNVLSNYIILRNYKLMTTHEYIECDPCIVF